MTAGLALACMAAVPAAAQTHVLRAAHAFPPDHFVSRFGIEPFIKRVTELSEGALKIEYFPGGQLGKAPDYLKLTQSGLMDMSFIAPSYVSDKMPLSSVAELPGMFTSGCEGTAAYWQILKSSRLLALDFAANKIVPLFVWILPPYQVISRDRRIADVKSLGGLKLRTTGGAMDIMAQRLGAVSVRMAAPEVYESLSRGTLDGLIFPLSSVTAYRLDELVKFSTEGENFGSFVAVWGMSEPKLKALPEAIRKVLVKVGEETVPTLCRQIDALEVETATKLQASGVQMSRLPDDERAKLKVLLAGVADEWASGLDGRGKPGTEILKAYRAALANPSAPRQ
ncbi:MAG: TRAP transporter substrate-binding protein DctP [Alphaproteobacteria bacterium]|nr:TRAP transporter substrate-binding protein DctP [Alphaproteobacteria bacterium]